jgi:hypothetical protein
MDTQETSRDTGEMGTQASDQGTGETPGIDFPNGNRALFVARPADADAADALRALDLEQPKAVIMIAGGAGSLDQAMEADDELKSRLVQLFSRGIARAAVDSGAAIIDGGTQSGVMSLMGQGVADRGRKTTLLGVVPGGKVTYPGGPPDGRISDGAPLDPNHSHFVLAESDEWGGETEFMFKLAEALAKHDDAANRVLTVLVSGNVDGIAKKEVLQSVRRGWPVIVIDGSGDLADEIAGLLKKIPSFIKDPDLAEIIADGDLHLLTLDESVDAVGDLITRQFRVDEETLKMAWGRFARCDKNAGYRQTLFRRVQYGILGLAVLGTFLALLQTTFRMKWESFGDSPGDKALHYVILVIPITVSVLLAAANRFNAGNKWLLLRTSAEAIKREIYRYRAKAAIYSKKQTARISRESKLARKVKSITREMMQTEVNASALRPYEGPIPPKMYGAAADDDGVSFLTPDQYVTIRLGDQLSFYRGKTARLERDLKRWQWAIYIAGGVGTLLAAIGLELWIALTTAVAAVLATILQFNRFEDTLVKYNQAATDLANVQGWWTALSPGERKAQGNVDQLVEYTEKILKDEHAGWVQEMQDSLAELQAEQEKEREDT